MPVKAASISL
jgi:hypothetical protein